MRSEVVGHLSRTHNWHLENGSSGFGYEHLVTPPLKVDVSYGEQMTKKALEEYQASEINGLRKALKVPREMRINFIGLIAEFEVDLDFLKSRGVDITEAREVIRQWNEIK